MVRDIGNANWWGRQVSIGDWVLQLRIRRKERRENYREWVKFSAYNYSNMTRKYG